MSDITPVKLTDRQQRFVEEYMIDLNATQSAIRAGYSPDSARQEGSRLLSNVNISRAIAERQAEMSKRTGISQELIIRELARIARINPTDLINFDDASLRDDISAEDAAAISGVKCKITPGRNGNTVEREIKLVDKAKALELLGKHFGMFIDRKEVSGPNGGPIELTAMTEEQRQKRINELLAQREHNVESDA